MKKMILKRGYKKDKVPVVKATLLKVLDLDRVQMFLNSDCEYSDGSETYVITIHIAPPKK